MFFWCFSSKNRNITLYVFRPGWSMFKFKWHLWSYSVMPTVKIGALFCPKYIKTSSIFSGNAQSFRGLRPLDPHQGLAPGPHRGPKAGPWTPPVMGFAPRRSPCTLCVHQIFSQFLYNFGRATFKSWLTPWFKLSPFWRQKGPLVGFLVSFHILGLWRKKKWNKNPDSNFWHFMVGRGGQTNLLFF